MLWDVLHEDGFGIVYLVLFSQARSRVLFEEPEDDGNGRAYDGRQLYPPNTATRNDYQLHENGLGGGVYIWKVL